MIWEREKLPEEDVWCWVTDGKSTWPAKRSDAAAGGWTNEDTWEDWLSEVSAWSILPAPPALLRVVQNERKNHD